VNSEQENLGMIRRVARWSAQLALASTAAFAWLGGCGVSPTVIAETIEAGVVSFTTPDAATDDAAPPTDITYCASNKCPEGWTTCPNSRFPCDVNLLRDADNCGACGNACPATLLPNAFTCNNGTCVHQCGPGHLLDCDGIPDNGCETAVTNQHCGACGKECLDPAMPCVAQPGGHYDCGCPPDERFCADQFRCVKRDDDNNCGACGNKCDPNNDGGTPPPDAFYGCANEQCGALKCNPLKGNCDGLVENGCETSLDTNDNCGACGNACPDGQACRGGPDAKAHCMCPPGRTFCPRGTSGNLEVGECVDVATDQQNCGACGVSCADYEIPPSARSSTVATCKYGSCVAECSYGFADCNRSESDGCEINTNSDPRNCGGCGIVCDAVAGQACVAGRCVVEPCSLDAGGGSAR